MGKLADDEFGRINFRHPHVLVVPLLRIDGVKYIQKKYSGTLGVCEGHREIDEVLNCFLHHTYIESERKLVFGDLQGIFYSYP